MENARVWGGLVLALSMWGVATPAHAKPYYPGDFTPDAKLEAIATRVGAGAPPLVRTAAMTRFRDKLRRIEASKSGQVRVLQLGDSHIAADFISGMTRHVLQTKFGNAGRGLVHADQRWGFGGRRTRRKETQWTRLRVVDARGPGKRYGLFGNALVAKRKGAKIQYKLLETDRGVEVHYEGAAKGAGFEVWAGKTRLAQVDAKEPGTQVLNIPLPADRKVQNLEIRALGRKTRLYGLGFSTGAPGLQWTSIGPVGADAKVYLQLEPESFTADLRHYRPDLVVLMVGGNDALKVRKRWKTLDTVVADHEALVARLRSALPQVEILLLAPMDAGQKKGKVVRSKPLITEMRDRQREIAEKLGLAYWDTLEAMGGPGAIQRWAKARVMNKDLVHPKKSAADLLGQRLGQAVLAWYSGSE